MHQSPARLQNIAAVVQYLWHLEKETGRKNSRGLILTLLVNYTVTLGKAFILPFYGCSTCVTTKWVPQDVPAAQVSCRDDEFIPRLCGAWQSRVPFVLPLEQTSRAPAPHTVDALPRQASRQPPSQPPCQPPEFTGFHLLPQIRFPAHTSGASFHAHLAPGFLHQVQPFAY